MMNWNNIQHHFHAFSLLAKSGPKSPAVKSVLKRDLSFFVDDVPLLCKSDCGLSLGEKDLPTQSNFKLI